MRAVIIGTSDKNSLFKETQFEEGTYNLLVKNYAKELLSSFDSLMCNPDDGVYSDIVREFGILKGEKQIAFYPDKDIFYGYEHLKKNFEYFDVKPINGNWYKLNAEITKQASCIICVGTSLGSLIELSYIKYHQKFGKFKNPNLANIHLFIDLRYSNKLPEEIESQIENIFYFSSFEELNQLIKKKKSNLEAF